MAEGCPYIAGPRCWDCDGSCWEPPLREPEPTAQDYCAAGGHATYGIQDGHEVCYCGTVTRPASPDLGTGDGEGTGRG